MKTKIFFICVLFNYGIHISLWSQSLSFSGYYLVNQQTDFAKRISDYRLIDNNIWIASKSTMGYNNLDMTIYNPESKDVKNFTLDFKKLGLSIYSQSMVDFYFGDSLLFLLTTDHVHMFIQKDSLLNFKLLKSYSLKDVIKKSGLHSQEFFSSIYFNHKTHSLTLAKSATGKLNDSKIVIIQMNIMDEKVYVVYKSKPLEGYDPLSFYVSNVSHFAMSPQGQYFFIKHPLIPNVTYLSDNMVNDKEIYVNLFDTIKGMSKTERLNYYFSQYDLKPTMSTLNQIDNMLDSIPYISRLRYVNESLLLLQVWDGSTKPFVYHYFVCLNNDGGFKSFCPVNEYKRGTIILKDSLKHENFPIFLLDHPIIGHSNKCYMIRSTRNILDKNATLEDLLIDRVAEGEITTNYTYIIEYDIKY